MAAKLKLSENYTYFIIENCFSMLAIEKDV